jgi:hypothetical protein
MTAREEKAARVRALREEGHTFRGIGEILGISLSYGCSLYYDPTGERGRTQAPALRAPMR